MQFSIIDVEQMEKFGGALANIVQPGQLVYVSGELGAGKTTLVRGVLRGHGHVGAVKSPTFTLVESYLFGKYQFFHFDLYRIQKPDELESIGFRDYLNATDYYFIEWPERGAGALPNADFEIDIEYADLGRLVRINSVDDFDVSLLAAFQ